MTCAASPLTMKFSETDIFFERLDEQIKAGNYVEVGFAEEKPGEKSKLWPRLQRCRGWDRIEDGFKQMAEGKPSLVAGLVSPQMGIVVTTGMLWLAAFVATLITAAIFYGIYKNYEIALEVEGEGNLEKETVTPRLRLRFVPRKAE